LNLNGLHGVISQNIEIFNPYTVCNDIGQEHQQYILILAVTLGLHCWKMVKYKATVPCKDWLHFFLRVCEAMLLKTHIIFTVSECPSVCTWRLENWRKICMKSDIGELYWTLSKKCKFRFRSDEINVLFTWRPTRVSPRISLTHSSLNNYLSLKYMRQTL
jgi:hypothetical protein